MPAPKKGVAFAFNAFLVDAANRPAFKSSPTIAAGDFKFSIDDGETFTNLATLPTANGRAVKISLSTSEMNADRVIVQCIDAAGAEWDDVEFEIHTTTLTVDDLSTLTSSDVQTAAHAAINAHDVPSWTEMVAAIAGGVSDTTVAVWSAATRRLSDGTNIVLAKGTGVTGFNDLSAAQVNTEADTALSDYGALKPTTAGRTLDVSATGEAGIDWANVGSPTTALNLSGTTISTSQVAASVTAGVTVTTNNDKTGYSLTVTPPTAAQVATAVEAAILDEGDATALLAAIAAKVDSFIMNDGDASATLAAIATAVWGNATRVLTAGTNIVLAKGTGVTGFTDLSAAQVNAEVDTALADYDAPTNTEMVAAFTEIKGATWSTTDTLEAIRDRGDAAWVTATGFSTHSASDVWAVATRTLTAFGFTVGTTDSADIDAILADTNELQTDWVNGGRLDLLIDGVKAKTDGLPSDPADASDIATAFTALQSHGDSTWSTATGFSTHSAADVWGVATRTLSAFGFTVSTSDSSNITAIKAKTDNLPVSPAATGDRMDLVNAPNATAITAIQSGLATSSALSSVASAIGTIGTNVGTVLSRLGNITGSGVNTVLGYFKALLSKTATLPTDIGGTFDPSADSTEAIRDRGDAAWGGSGGGNVTVEGFTQTALTQIAERTINIFSPLLSGDSIELVRGDDYLVVDSRHLFYRNTAGSWPDLTGATVTLICVSNDGRSTVEYNATVFSPTGTTQEIRTEITAAESGAMAQHKWHAQWQAVLANTNVVTLADIDLTVIDRLE